jgi:hypothetical protein
MNAVLDVVPKSDQPDQASPKRKVGWPKGKARGPRKPRTDVALAGEQQKPARRRGRNKKPAGKQGEITQAWQVFRAEYLNPQGQPEVEARKAYHKGASDVLMLLGKHVGESLPPAFMTWVEQCQAGLLGKD